MSSFLVTEATHYFEVVDWNSTTFRAENIFCIEAQHPERFFLRHYYWTGSGLGREPIPELVTKIDQWGFPEHRIHGPVIVEGSSRILVTDLGRTLNVGERTDVHFRHKLKDLAQTFEPFLKVAPSAAIRDRLTLRLNLPSWKGLQVSYHRFTHDTAKTVESCIIEPFEEECGRSQFKKEIINPSKSNMGHVLAWDKFHGPASPSMI